MSANPTSGYTKREGDPDKGEQGVRHYCTNCWWEVLQHKSATDVQSTAQVAEQQATIIDPAKRNGRKRSSETRDIEANAL